MAFLDSGSVAVEEAFDTLCDYVGCDLRLSWGWRFVGRVRLTEGGTRTPVEAAKKYGSVCKVLGAPRRFGTNVLAQIINQPTSGSADGMRVLGSII